MEVVGVVYMVGCVLLIAAAIAASILGLRALAKLVRRI